MSFIVSDRTVVPLCEHRTRPAKLVGSSTRLSANGRIMHLSRVGYIGGAEKVMLALASNAVNEGREVFLACPPGLLADEAQRRGIRVLLVAFSRMQISCNPLKYVKYGLDRIAGGRRVLELCREHAIDILHAHHPVTALYCEYAISLLDLPLVLHVHEGPPGRRLYFLALRRAAKLASRVICVSNAGIDLLISAGVRLDKAQVIHNGVHLPEVGLYGNTKTPRRDELRIAVIGMLEPRKGQDLFVEAIAMVAPGIPNLKCYIIGDAPTKGLDRYKQKLTARVKRLGLEQTIEFVSYIPNIIERMSSYDIIVSSSRGTESLGFVILEAMTQGTTVVAARVGGIEDVIRHGANGFLAEPGCPYSLRDAICEAMACDRARVGKEAQEIRESFGVEAMCTAVAEVYANLKPTRANAPG